MATIRIAGFDPGLLRTGWGVIEFSGSRLSHIANGVVATKSSDDLGVRLKAAAVQLDAARHRDQRSYHHAQRDAASALADVVHLAGGDDTRLREAVEYAGFLLMPFGFFDRNPALDVPPSPPGACHTDARQ